MQVQFFKLASSRGLSVSRLIHACWGKGRRYQSSMRIMNCTGPWPSYCKHFASPSFSSFCFTIFSSHESLGNCESLSIHGRLLRLNLIWEQTTELNCLTVARAWSVLFEWISWLQDSKQICGNTDPTAWIGTDVFRCLPPRLRLRSWKRSHSIRGVIHLWKVTCLRVPVQQIYKSWSLSRDSSRS